MKKAEVIGEFGQMRQQVRHHLAALAAWLEAPERLGDVAGWAFERHCRNLRRLLTMQLCEHRLVVKRVDMADRARAEDDQHPLRGHRKV